MDINYRLFLKFPTTKNLLCVKFFHFFMTLFFFLRKNPFKFVIIYNPNCLMFIINNLYILSFILPSKLTYMVLYIATDLDDGCCDEDDATFSTRPV